MSKAIRRTSSRDSAERGRGLGTSYRSQHGEQATASLAEESIARDLEDEDLEEAIEDQEQEGGLSREISAAALSEHSLASSHRRPSLMPSGSHPFLQTQQPESVIPVEQEREEAISEERSLLRDNKLIPPKHPRRRRNSQASDHSQSGLKRRISIPGFSIPRQKSKTFDEEAAIGANERAPAETTALLSDGAPPPDLDPDAPYEGEDTAENIDKKWSEAVLNGQIHTTWQREAKVLAKYSGPLIFTFILQNSLTLVSIFTVGHIGKNELGAVSLGGMTANITGYAVFHGLATSLDTLCAQAYGSGRKKLVGLQLQRMVFFLWTATIPIAIIWLFGTQILLRMVPEKEIAILAGRYLKVLILGAPGYACFESSKRYVQAQGRFAATLYVLLIAAPLNVLMHWLFVWQFQWGFIGCPIAIVITENLMPLLLFLYVRFVGGMDCWPGFTRKAFVNWGPMVRLALPGCLMVMAEFLAFEILIFAAARFSATHLATQGVLQSMTVLTYQLPFPISVAGSTRVANLIGATLPDAAKVTTRVIFVVGAFLGLFNMILLASLRNHLPWLWTSDPDVVVLASKTMLVNAAFQLWDALAAQCNGVLRGLGKQAVGGYISLFAFYVVSDSYLCPGRVGLEKLTGCQIGGSADIVRDWFWFRLGVVWSLGWPSNCTVRSICMRGRVYLQNELAEGERGGCEEKCCGMSLLELMQCVGSLVDVHGTYRLNL